MGCWWWWCGVGIGGGAVVVFFVVVIVAAIHAIAIIIIVIVVAAIGGIAVVTEYTLPLGNTCQRIYDTRKIYLDDTSEINHMSHSYCIFISYGDILYTICI